MSQCTFTDTVVIYLKDSAGRGIPSKTLTIEVYKAIPPEGSRTLITIDTAVTDSNGSCTKTYTWNLNFGEEVIYRVSFKGDTRYKASSSERSGAYCPA